MDACGIVEFLPIELDEKSPKLESLGGKLEEKICLCEDVLYESLRRRNWICWARDWSLSIRSRSRSYLHRQESQKVATLRKGISQFFEPGLSQMMSENIAHDRLAFSDQLADGLKEAQIVFIAVGNATAV